MGETEVPRRATVLVCDDDATVRRLVRTTLERDGHTVVEAAEPRDAAARVRERPDVILLELMLAGQSGHRLLADLRNDPASAAIPVIALTTQAQAANLEALRTAGIDHLRKPFSPLALSSVVAQALSKVDRLPAAPIGAVGDIIWERRLTREIDSLNRTLAARAANLERKNAELHDQAEELRANLRAVERLLDLNRAVLQASFDGIRLVDLQGRTILANPVIDHLTSEVFGLPRDATLHERSMIAERLADPSAYLATMERIAANPECVTSDRFEIVDLERSFQRHTGPVRDSAGELIGRIIVVREITAEREAERLELADSLKSELVATVSHELRTPLTAVLGFTELLLQGEIDEDTRTHHLETIHSEAQRLTELIDDFLDIQKIEAGHFDVTLEPFALDEILAHQIDVFQAQSEHHTLELAPADQPLTVVGDATRIGQVIANLLSNAIKYSPDGGTVRVSARSTNDGVRVSVSDPGLGIPPEQQELVFTQFFRVDSSDTREITGTGLGLSLCQEIVEAHGGRMGLESDEGQGSTFWFEIPAPQALPLAA